MGKAFLAKSMGGGGGLNFRVIGSTTAPANPKMNDIWVNTPNEITSYIFSPTEPKDYANGMVWFKTGTTGRVDINAIKKNVLTVSINSCKQHIGGSWQNMPMQIYQNEWIDCSMLYIYNNGETTGYSFKCNETLKQLDSGYAADASKVSVGTNKITVTNGSVSYSFTDIFATENGNFVKYDLSQYSKIRIKGTVTGATRDTACVFRALTSFGTLCTQNNALSKAIYTGTVDLTIDISSINSSSYLGFTFYNEATTFTLTEMWLE